MKNGFLTNALFLLASVCTHFLVLFIILWNHSQKDNFVTLSLSYQKISHSTTSGKENRISISLKSPNIAKIQPKLETSTVVIKDRGSKSMLVQNETSHSADNNQQGSSDNINSSSSNSDSNGNDFLVTLNKNNASYPALARRMGEEGIVHVCCIIENGVAKHLRLCGSSGSATLDEAAQKTVSSWKFKTSHSTQSEIVIPIKYKLSQSEK